MPELDPEVSPELQVGRRALDAVAGCEILEDFQWLGHGESWGLHLALEPAGLVPTEFVPARTCWFLLVSPDYPDGHVGLYPANEDGLVHTFPHQAANLPWDSRPFRQGKICTDTSLGALSRHGLDEEPRTCPDRLRWHVRRALLWLVEAARGALLQPGEPFELPVYFPNGSLEVIGFLEEAGTFRSRASTMHGSGLAEIVRYPRWKNISVIRQISRWSGEPLYRAEWGKNLATSDEVELAVWVLLSEPPYLPPWQAPANGKELFRAARNKGTDLSSFLKQVPGSLRDGKRHYLLLSFPIPRRVSEGPERLHWLAVRLPVLSRLTETVDGFTPRSKGRLERDRRALLRDHLEWVKTENWAPDEISTRGRFGSELREMKVLLIGVGALGSAVAELLVRGGVYRLLLLDPDTMTAGNLVRHSLTLPDVGRDKAEAMAQWLNDLSPHARVEYSTQGFPTDDPAELIEFGLVIDCTGSDDVAARMERFAWPGERLFVSASVGAHARRLFLFEAVGSRFPRDVFAGSLQPWLAEDRPHMSTDDLPLEGIGCWSVLFPARVEDLRIFAAVIVKELERFSVARESAARLLVWERDERGCVRQAGCVEDG